MPVGARDIFRNELGCGAGFVKITSDFPGGTFIDNGVVNGTTYFYQVVAHAVGNEACASAPTFCWQQRAVMRSRVRSQM